MANKIYTNSSGSKLFINATTGSFIVQDSGGVVVGPSLPSIQVVDPAIVPEGQTTVFRIELSSAWTAAIQFTFTTGDGSGTAGTNYTSNSGTRIIAAGSTFEEISVTTISDGLFTSRRDFYLTISDAKTVVGLTPLTIAKAQGTAFLSETSDPPPSSAHAYYEGLLALGVGARYTEKKLRDQNQLNTLVVSSIDNSSGNNIDNPKISRTWSYVYPNDDTLYRTSAYFTPKDGARLYHDGSRTITSPYYDPDIPPESKPAIYNAEKYRWAHAGNFPSRDAVLAIPLNVSPQTPGNSSIMVTYDIWYANYWRYNRTEFDRQFKPSKFESGSNTYWSCGQHGGTPQPGVTIPVPSSQAFGYAMHTLDAMERTTAGGAWPYYTTNDMYLINKDSIEPTGLGAVPAKGMNFPWDTWIRHWYRIDFLQPHTAFTEWNTHRGYTIPSNAADEAQGWAPAGQGKYHMLSHWMAGETWGPYRVVYKVPWFTDNRSTFKTFQIHFHTSQDTVVETGPLVAYARNLVALKNYTLAATPETDTFLFQRPVP